MTIPRLTFGTSTLDALDRTIIGSWFGETLACVLCGIPRASDVDVRTITLEHGAAAFAVCSCCKSDERVMTRASELAHRGGVWTTLLEHRRDSDGQRS